MKSEKNSFAVRQLTDLYERCEADFASDIHLTAGEAPYLRTEGVLMPVDGCDVLDAGICDAIGVVLALNTIAPGIEDPEAEVRKRLFSVGAIDGATTSPAGHRYRFNVYRENNSTAVAMRRLDDRFLSLKELGLPPQLESFCG